MSRRRSAFAIASVILCFLSAQVDAAMADGASDGPQSARVEVSARVPGIEALTVGTAVAPPPPLIIPENLFAAWTDTSPTSSAPFAQRGYGRRGRGRNDGARAAIILGAVAAIAGTAVLVYANRPECSTNPAAGGCGYGTKVVGTAVLAGGVVSLAVGALTWR
jgi:hypothetical protein